MKKPDYAITMAALLLLTTVTALSSTPIKPSSTLVTKRVSGIGHFDEIVTNGIVNVEYSQSRDGKTTVWVCGNDNLVDLVEMSSEGGTLQISMKKCDFSGGNASLKVIASSPSLSSATTCGPASIIMKSPLSGSDITLTTTGPGNIEAAGMAYDKFTATVTGPGGIDIESIRVGEANLHITGSGNVNIAGTAERTIMNVAGSGSIDASALAAATASGNVTGAGGMSLKCTEQVEVKLAGSGSVRVRGAAHNAKITAYGSGYVDATELTAHELYISAQGPNDVACRVSGNVTAKTLSSGNIEITGEAVKASLTTANSGNIHAEKLKALDVVANTFGSGGISCHATRSIKITETGVGSVSYTGAPETVSRNGGARKKTDKREIRK